MFRYSILGVVLAVLLGTVVAGPVPKDSRPKVSDKNTNALILSHKTQLKLSASTTWNGWPIEQLVDQDERTSWYSNSGDSPTNKSTPWVEVKFPETVTIKRVTILGNRDPTYPNGYLVTEGYFELYDADGKKVQTHELKSNDTHDFDWILNRKTTVRSIKFLATKNQEGYNCIGLSELLVE